ncbi:MAG: hypothetical protein KKD48_05885 [Nanoarchaeota archaeon]|nr:hypothetical protein [Nanoarchaeota archaeon]
MDNKGFVRTLEAVIAIVVIFIFIFTVLPSQKIEQKVPNNIKLIQDKVVNEIESNESLRKNVLTYPSSSDAYYPADLTALERDSKRIELNSFIENSFGQIRTIDFNFTVCNELNQDCMPDFINKDPNCGICYPLPNKQVYAKSIMISNATASRIFRLYLWESI